MGEEGSSAASFLSFCPLLGRVRFACCFLLGCWCTAPPRPLPRALRKLGCFGGPAGVPGLEERRAEWLTTFNFCFSVGLGWGIFFFHVSKFLLPLFEEPLLFILSFLLSILSEEPGLKWDKKEAILRTAGAGPCVLPPGPVAAGGGRGPRRVQLQRSQGHHHHTELHPILSVPPVGILPPPQETLPPSARVQLAFPWASCPAGRTPVAGAGTSSDLGSGHVSNCLSFCVGPGGWRGCQARAFVPRGVWGGGVVGGLASC